MWQFAKPVLKRILDGGYSRRFVRPVGNDLQLGSL
jgi:hypothetical protein